MKFLALAAVTTSLIVTPVFAEEGQPREVNVTYGSTPGWHPSKELEEQALRAWNAFYDALADGRIESAWMMMSPAMKRQLPLEDFKAQAADRLAENGPVRTREPAKLTWTKDAPEVPAPGIYVAIDASARFERTQRECGYTVLYQAPGTDAFVVSRTESTSMSDEAYHASASNTSELQAALVWRAVSSVCPNYTPPPLPETVGEGIEFGSVAEALAALESRTDLETRVENGWSIIFDHVEMQAWSFAPDDSPYYPSVVLRSVENVPGAGAKVQMSMKCEVEKSLCDALFTEMAMLNGFVPLAEK